MASSEIKIFYSWQSDLPGNQTRNLIQDSIDAAVKVMKNTVEIVADRDTKGEFGSPDIAQTIFSKIDDCDIFIADVSIINKYHSVDEEGNISKEIKTTPNPNVLVELGYAAHVLGWENVICIINTDFGSIEELPFDIGHRRLTPYSMKEKSRTDVKKDLRDIIAATVMNLLENGIRIKGAYASHIVGGYDLEEKNVSKKITKFDIVNSQWYRNMRNSMLSECKILIDEIKGIKLQPYQENPVVIASEMSEDCSTDEDIVTPNGIKLSPLSKEWLKKFNTSSHIVKVKESNIQLITQQVKDLLGIDLPDEFFCMGSLHIENSFIVGQPNVYIGTENEKTKYHKFMELEYKLARVQMLDFYIGTFSGMCLLPMAIFNSSTHFDKDISIIIKVDEETADVIIPTADLINEEIKGLEGWVYEEGIIKNLLLMPETSDIQYDSDISYDISDSINQMRNIPIPGIKNSSPQFDSEDYERELRKYIASPMDGSTSNFEYYIKDLRPKEKKWLGAAVLVRPKKDKIIFDYAIKSQHSNGELCGTLEWESVHQ
jgi:hypothetical protein